jgi:hypothetical protein
MNDFGAQMKLVLGLLLLTVAGSTQAKRGYRLIEMSGNTLDDMSVAANSAVVEVSSSARPLLRQEFASN